MAGGAVEQLVGNQHGQILQEERPAVGVERVGAILCVFQKIGVHDDDIPRCVGTGIAFISHGGADEDDLLGEGQVRIEATESAVDVVYTVLDDLLLTGCELLHLLSGVGDEFVERGPFFSGSPVDVGLRQTVVIG